MTADADVDIGSRIERLEEIAETLEDGEIGLETAKELREEADEHLEALGEALDAGEGDIIELDGEEIDPDDTG
ncbi:exodeoxyribonuclease VII small subunit [Halovivax sp.]|uniref:exodeoxyribonuclease VII small subunit n=1 Tax=Halovivax sp. TaxID=1935978 RepID=UPI0025C16D28|nr:exodeoxyribonuclease VII small subunit [Halovivax sp.]